MSLSLFNHWPSLLPHNIQTKIQLKTDHMQIILEPSWMEEASISADTRFETSLKK